MRFESFCRTYYSGGGLSPTLGLAVAYLSVGSSDFRGLIERVELEVYFRSCQLPRQDFEESLENYNKRLDSLPKSRFDRKRNRLKIEYESKVVTAEAVSDPPPMEYNPYEDPIDWNDREAKPELFKPFLEEAVEQIRNAFRKKIKSTDDFDHKRFDDWLSRKVPKEPISAETITEIEEQVRQWFIANPLNFDEWEILDIDWDDFHPDARSILDDPFFWTPVNDFSPHGNDTGHDVLSEYRRWRKRNPKGKEEKFVLNLLSNWGMSEAHRDHAELGVIYDEVFIALAFAQIKIEGSCSKWSGTKALDAVVNRRLHSGEQYGENFDKLQNKLLAFVPDYQFEEIEETGLFVVDDTANDEEELEEEGSLREIEESSSTISELDDSLRINAKIILKNSDPDGAVWIEARLSNTGVPFLDLPLVEGFPRWIKENEVVEIDLQAKKELLFRRGMYAFDPELKADEIRMCGYLYRIGNPRNLEVVKGFLWRGPRLSRKYPCKEPGAPGQRVSQNELTDVWVKRRRYVSTRYIIEPICKEGGYDDFVFRIYLQATDLKSGKTGQRLIAEAPHYECVHMLDEIVVKKGSIHIRPQPTVATFMRERGFAAPFEIGIDLILNSKAMVD